MTYPTLPIAVGASYETKTDRVLERASNGTLRGRVSFTAPKRVFKIKHPALSISERDTLTAFHAANMASVFSFDWLGTNYTCVFGSDPSYSAINGLLCDVDLTLEEV